MSCDVARICPESLVIGVCGNNMDNSTVKSMSFGIHCIVLGKVGIKLECDCHVIAEGHVITCRGNETDSNENAKINDLQT